MNEKHIYPYIEWLNNIYQTHTKMAYYSDSMYHYIDVYTIIDYTESSNRTVCYILGVQ